jgi:hypothetical protein
MRSADLITLTSFLLLVSCGKREDLDPCDGHPVPWIALSSWPTPLDPYAVDTVPRDNIRIDFYCNAGPSSTYVGNLTGVHVRLAVTATDSTLFDEQLQPDASSFTYGRAIVLNNITDSIPATLHIAAVNSCGNGVQLERSMLVVPN